MFVVIQTRCSPFDSFPCFHPRRVLLFLPRQAVPRISRASKDAIRQRIVPSDSNRPQRDDASHLFHSLAARKRKKLGEKPARSSTSPKVSNIIKRHQTKCRTLPKWPTLSRAARKRPVQTSAGVKRRRGIDRNTIYYIHDIGVLYSTTRPLGSRPLSSFRPALGSARYSSTSFHVPACPRFIIIIVIIQHTRKRDREGEKKQTEKLCLCVTDETCGKKSASLKLHFKKTQSSIVLSRMFCV